MTDRLRRFVHPLRASLRLLASPSFRRGGPPPSPLLKEGGSIWNCYAFYSAVVAGHGVGYVSAFEGWAGGAGCGVELVSVAGDDFGVGADVDEHDGFVLFVDGDG